VSMVPANGYQCHVQEIVPAAARATVVLIHGLTGDTLASWYFTLASPLAAVGLRVVMYDLRGHGNSGRPASGYQVDDFVDDLGALLDVLGLDKPVYLIGNSFGAVVAFGYAARCPRRVAGVVSLDSAPPIATWLDLAAHERVTRQRQLMLHADDAELERRGRTGNFARRARRLRLLVAETTFEEDLRASSLPDPDTFAAVDCPVLCMYGEKSRMRDLLTPTLELIPHAETSVLPGQGHDLLFKQTAQVRDQILAWLKKTAPEGNHDGTLDHSK
jgi:pimeloyl-ACP methyl ester carboxylesterase